jgi:hypothetical protein
MRMAVLSLKCGFASGNRRNSSTASTEYGTMSSEPAGMPSRLPVLAATFRRSRLLMRVAAHPPPASARRPGGAVPFTLARPQILERQLEGLFRPAPGSGKRVRGVAEVRPPCILQGLPRSRMFGYGEKRAGKSS